MTEERITETTTPSGDTHTTHTIVHADGGRKGGGSSWVMLLVLVVLAIGGFYLFSQMSGAEVAKDNAVTEAANEVGEAAGQVGEASQNAGEAVENAVEN